MLVFQLHLFTYTHIFLWSEKIMPISTLPNIKYAVTSRGHSHWKGVWGCAAVVTPFFQASCRSLAYQFTVNAPLLWPPFSVFRKFLDFQPWFGQNSNSLDPNFSPFFKKNPLPRPYILKPTWYTSTKKVECPPQGYIMPILKVGYSLMFNGLLGKYVMSRME